MCDPGLSDDATLQKGHDKNYHDHLPTIDDLCSKPFVGRRFAIIKETVGAGVDVDVVQRILETSRKMEALGAIVDIISCVPHSISVYLHTTYLLYLRRAAVARYDNIRFGADSSPEAKVSDRK